MIKQHAYRSQAIGLLGLAVAAFWALVGCAADTSPQNNTAKLAETTQPDSLLADTLVRVGAARMDAYRPLLEGKRLALTVNHTSRIGHRHLVDTLQALGLDVRKVFAPEHGYKGDADAGKKIEDGQHQMPSIEVVSLYGKRYKPEPQHMDSLDLVIFDMQDVGARFYTYISTMTNVMEACAEAGVPMLILDRPNPNGHYVDGPVLESHRKSFVGMHPIPIVHGLTVGELALMINGEGWLKDSLRCELSVIRCQGWDHAKAYELPIRPSPNLPNTQSIRLYPSLCLFEGTVASVGRGTDFPFQVVGHPDFDTAAFSFTPQSVAGAQKPKYHRTTCYGQDFRRYPIGDSLDLQPILQMHAYLKGKGRFFNSYFPLLAGNDSLEAQIRRGATAREIRLSWQPELDQFRRLRKQYLLYPDFDGQQPTANPKPITDSIPQLPQKP